MQLKQEPAKNCAMLVIKLIYEMKGALAFVERVYNFFGVGVFTEALARKVGLILGKFLAKILAKIG